MSKIKKITHISIHRIYKDRIFDNVNSYEEMNSTIERYGGEQGDTDLEKKSYNDRVGMPFEIFTQYFYLRYNNIPTLGVKDIRDTSEDKYNEGFDFTYTDLLGKRGHIQSKWRSNPMHQFTSTNMAMNGLMARGHNVPCDNNILFLNFDPHEKLFEYTYTIAKNVHRVVGMNTQEMYILRDPEFWNDFRKCIKYSAENFFRDPYTLRDIQEWILYGNDTYIGTQAVINRLISKGRVEAATASGKTLCIYHNVLDAFKTGRDVVVVTIPWLSLIDQTLKEFYISKMFGYDDKNGNTYSTGIACIIMSSKCASKYDPSIVDIYRSLNSNHIIGKVKEHLANNKKVLIFVTNASYEEKYEKKVLNGLLNEKVITTDKIFEIVDEYHNLIPSYGERHEFLKRAQFIVNYSNRNSGTIFYSASNKRGEIINSFNEEQFGILLCRVTREDLRIRGYVCPELIFKIIMMKSLSPSNAMTRAATRKGLTLKRAQLEAAGIVIAFNDLKTYYKEPNLITFGNQVAGCLQIAGDDNVKKLLPGVELHVMVSDTPSNKREEIIDTIKSSGNNILNQHSVAKEGVDIPNLNGGLTDRGMDPKSLQQGIGRSDRALIGDTERFQKGEISLYDPTGWEKYYNVIYSICEIDNEEDEAHINLYKDIVRYLKTNGIPKERWNIATIEDEPKNGVITSPINLTGIDEIITFSDKKMKRMIKLAEILVDEEFEKENKTISIDLKDLKKEIATKEENDKEENKFKLMTHSDWLQHQINLFKK